jgi:hypothetical protein
MYKNTILQEGNKLVITAIPVAARLVKKTEA